MNLIKRYFKWTSSLSAYKLMVLYILLLILGSVWLVYIVNP